MRELARLSSQGGPEAEREFRSLRDEIPPHY
jgi:hypothetical protein